MKRLKIAFLINPISGGSQGLRTHSHLLHVLKKFSIPQDQYQIEFTRPGETVLQAKRLANEAENLIVVGGDGTAVESITGAYLSGSKVQLGLIPLGTGNDLARSLQIYETFKQEGIEGCLERFLKGAIAPLDIWEVNKKELMVNYLSVGLDSAIVHSFSTKRTMIPFNSVLLNRLAYAVIGISHSFYRIRENVILKFWEEERVKEISLRGYRLVLVSNLPFYAGGTLLSPHASFSDGFLEITPIPRLIQLIGLFVFQECHCLRKWYGERLTHFRAKQIEIEVPGRNYLQIDGEDKTFLLHSKKVEIGYCGQVTLLKGD